MDAPHRWVTGALSGAMSGVQGVIGSAASGAKGAGESLMQALDKPVQDALGLQGPHRIADRLLDAGVDAVQNFWGQGVVGSLKIGIEGVARALDQPVEQTGGLEKRSGRLPWQRR